MVGLVTMARTLSALLGPRAYEVAIFEAFAENIDDYLTAPDLEAITDVPHTTIYRILERLQETGAVNLVGKDGRTNLFRLNTSHPVIRIHMRAYHEAQAEALESEMAQPGWRIAATEKSRGFETTGYDSAEISFSSLRSLDSNLVRAGGA